MNLLSSFRAVDEVNGIYRSKDSARVGSAFEPYHERYGSVVLALSKTSPPGSSSTCRVGGFSVPVVSAARKHR